MDYVHAMHVLLLIINATLHGMRCWVENDHYMHHGHVAHILNWYCNG